METDHRRHRFARVPGPGRDTGALASGNVQKEWRHAISAVLEVSLALLSAPGRLCLAELSIFPDDVPIPLAAAASVWNLDEIGSEDAAQRLARLSLLKLDLERAVLRLHDVMRSWLASCMAVPTQKQDVERILSHPG